MDNNGVLSRIAGFVGGFMKRDGLTATLPDLAGLQLPATVSGVQFEEIIGLLKEFLGSAEGKTVGVNTRNHLSATVTQAEKAGVLTGWSNLKDLIAGPKAQEIVQPLLAFAFKHQDKYQSIIKLFADGE